MIKVKDIPGVGEVVKIKGIDYAVRRSAVHNTKTRSCIKLSLVSISPIDKQA